MKIPKAEKLPSGSYRIRMRLGDESISITRATEQDCKREAQVVKAEYLARKRDPKAKEPEKQPTISEAIDSYIAKRDGSISPSTISGYRCIQHTRFKSIMNQSLSDLSDGDIVLAYNQEAKMVSGKTLKNSWAFVKCAVKEETGRIFPAVVQKQVIRHERPYLDPDQVKVFIAAVKDTNVAIPALLGLHSLRKSEILALTWENVDLEKRLIYVRGAAVIDENNRLVQKPENKNQSSNRTVPIMLNVLYDALSAVEPENRHGLIVKNMERKLYGRINVICRKNGLPEIGVHGLRHSFASLAYHLDIPIRVTMVIGGWSDYGTVQKIYTHLANCDLSSSVARMSDFLNSGSESAAKA